MFKTLVTLALSLNLTLSDQSGTGLLQAITLSAPVVRYCRYRSEGPVC